MALAGCPADTAQVLEALTVECVPSAEGVPSGGWVCPEARTIECNVRDASESHTIYVSEADAGSCEGQTFSVASEGGLTLGEHDVQVLNEQGDVICESELTVVDTVAPVLASKTIALWPPNHKFHSIAVEDCVAVEDACDGSVQADFIWASSDEPADANGDGHHDPDIKLGEDCRHVLLRSERQGPENGRVYTLGVRAIDAAGNQTESTCRVIVAHDQSGKQRRGEGEAVNTDSSRKPSVAVAGEEAYRLTFDGSDGNAACGEREEVPETPEPSDGDAGTPPEGETPETPESPEPEVPQDPQVPQ